MYSSIKVCELLLYKTLENAINCSECNNDSISKEDLKLRYDFVFGEIRKLCSSIHMPSDYETYNNLLNDLKSYISDDEFCEFSKILDNSKLKKQINTELSQSVWEAILHVLKITEWEPYKHTCSNNYIKEQFIKNLSDVYYWITIIDN